MYREMWERLKENILITLDDGRRLGFDNPKSTKYDKFFAYNHIFDDLTNIERGVIERRREGRRPVVFANEWEITPDQIKTVIFNNPATIVIWKDGSKTVVKCQPRDTYSKETGLALCIAKKFLGNKGSFNDVFKKWIPEGKEISIEEMRKALYDFCDSRHCGACSIHTAIPDHKCGRGYCYLDLKSEDEIRKAYEVAFGEA